MFWYELKAGHIGLRKLMFVSTLGSLISTLSLDKLLGIAIYSTLQILL